MGGLVLDTVAAKAVSPAAPAALPLDRHELHRDDVI